MGSVLKERLQSLEDKLFFVEIEIEKYKLGLEHQKKVAKMYKENIEQIKKLLNNE